jgi:acyl-CoA synthetase (AMP-forming)/AMP-acid ligase II
MAVAFLAVAAGATCVPLNPAYSLSEFAFCLAALHPKALIVQAGLESPVRAIAHRRGLPIIELSPILETEAGLFTLTGEVHPRTIPCEFAQPGDTALVIHTSGTTSQPKIVPLTHANLSMSAYNTRMALGLVASDRCLNVLQLFHTYGAIGVVLTSLVAGASVVCTPGFDASTFFAWLAEFRPTWYPAVPTVYALHVAHCGSSAQVLLRCHRRSVQTWKGYSMFL